jgi:hypothetical protein
MSAAGAGRQKRTERRATPERRFMKREAKGIEGKLTPEQEAGRGKASFAY